MSSSPDAAHQSGDNAADTLKQAILAELEAHRAELVALSHRIHANPELGFEEDLAADWCTTMLEESGLSVRRGVCDLPTAFEATAGNGEFTVAVCAEYDALPDIGHACGHNVIAAAAVGTGLALAR